MVTLIFLDNGSCVKVRCSIEDAAYLVSICSNIPAELIDIVFEVQP